MSIDGAGVAQLNQVDLGQSRKCHPPFSVRSLFPNIGQTLDLAGSDRFETYRDQRFLIGALFHRAQLPVIEVERFQAGFGRMFPLADPALKGHQNQNNAPRVSAPACEAALEIEQRMDSGVYCAATH